MSEPSTEQIAKALDLNVESLSLIQENAYCHIYCAGVDGESVIIKKYKGNDTHLVETEARALDFYHEIAKTHPELIDSKTVKLNKEQNILAIGFVEGECFSSVLYRARKEPDERERSIRAMSILGTFLKDLYDRTCSPGDETDPFIFEYMAHCSTRLRGLPVLGVLFFRDVCEDAAALSREFRAAEVPPSFVHGDFVFKNIHLSGERVGLIDFANTISRSHVLNDIYNLRLALDNMMLPRSFKSELLSAFYDAFGDHSFPEIAHRFYYEYHRRRWLMLKIGSRTPLGWLQGTRGLVSFARPFTPEIATP